MDESMCLCQAGGIGMLFSDLKCREVINVCTGERYGNVCDLEFDPCGGQIAATREGMAIPFSKIKKLGEDVILVEL